MEITVQWAQNLSLEHKKVSEMDDGDGCTMWVQLMPLNCTPKTQLTASIMCILSQYEKKKYKTGSEEFFFLSFTKFIIKKPNI